MNKMLYAVVLGFLGRLIVWYWRVVELLGVIRRRSDIIISSTLIGLLVAMTFTAAVKPVFSSRAKVNAEHMDANGHVTNGLPRPDANPQSY
jgi:uncharacterized protein involved in exopolysaccharide biosynthesis